MLRGNALAKVDEKGRLKLPVSFRSIIEPRYGNEFFVTSLRGDSVRIYPMDVWVRIEQRLAQASSFQPAVMRFRNAVNYYGQGVAMDSQGRILIHPLLRDVANTKGDVAVLGLHDHLEVWDHAAFATKLADDPVSDEDLVALAGLGIG